MGNIELPTYKTIVPNEVFVKNGKMIGEVFSKQALIIERYRVPTKEDVMKTIIEEAEKMQEVSAKKEGKKLSEFLGVLPNSEIGDIANMKQNSLDHLARHYESCGFQEGRIYLEASSGLLPDYLFGFLK